MTVATCPWQTGRDSVEGRGLLVLDSRRANMTCGTCGRFDGGVYIEQGGVLSKGKARKDPASYTK